MESIIVTVLFLIAIFYSFKLPAIGYSLLLLAGSFKGDPRVAHLNSVMDITIVFLLISVLNLSTLPFKSDKRIWLPKFSLLFFLFISTFMFFSLSYTISPIFGLDKSFRFFVFVGTAVLLPAFFIRTYAHFQQFMIPFIIIGLIMSIQSLFFSTSELSSQDTIGSNYLAFGRIGGAAIICLLFFRNQLKLTIHKLFFVLGAIFLFFAIVSSGGRGPLLSLFLTALVFFVSNEMKVLSSFRLPANSIQSISKPFKGIFLLLLVVALSSTAFVFSSLFFASETDRYRIALEGGGASIGTRVEFISIAINSIFSKDWFLGVGVGGFNSLSGRPDALVGTYPHNIFLEFWVELGVLSFLAFTLYLLVILKLSTRFSSKSHFSTGHLMFALVFFSLLNSLVSGSLIDNKLLFSFLSIAEIFYAIRLSKQSLA